MRALSGMSTEKNKEIVKRLIEAHIRNEKETVGELLSPKLKWHHAGMPDVMSRDDYLAGLDEGNAAFSDMAHDVHALIGEGDRVVTHTTVRMRHTGKFEGIHPSGKNITFESMWMYRVVDGRVVECWGFDEDFKKLLE
jgi:predicted ester cyclase